MSGRTTVQKHTQIMRLLARDGDLCHWCRAAFGAIHPVTLEHLIPRHYGGTNEDGNVVLACAGCNHARHHLVRCAGCGHRIKRFRHVVWVDRRDVFHGACAPRIAVR